MITIKLLGGLGNQMFQAAFGIALRARGYQVQYDKTALVEGTHREYSLGYFKDLPFGVPDGEVITEKSQLFDMNYLYPPPSSTMLGYWQNEKYFWPVKFSVRDLFQFKEPSVRVAELLQEIRNCESAFVHVRRQDYVNLQHFHGMPTIEYYRKALAFLPSTKKVFIFSDDKQWCRENFPHRFTVVDGTNKYEDLQLMVACQHAVIANSSFSWWGAWLGDRMNRTIIAPKRWFADETAEANASDIVPPRWMRI